MRSPMIPGARTRLPLSFTLFAGILLALPAHAVKRKFVPGCASAVIVCNGLTDSQIGTLERFCQLFAGSKLNIVAGHGDVIHGCKPPSGPDFMDKPSLILSCKGSVPPPGQFDFPTKMGIACAQNVPTKSLGFTARIEVSCIKIKGGKGGIICLPVAPDPQAPCAILSTVKPGQRGVSVSYESLTPAQVQKLLNEVSDCPIIVARMPTPKASENVVLGLEGAGKMPCPVRLRKLAGPVILYVVLSNEEVGEFIAENVISPENPICGLMSAWDPTSWIDGVTRVTFDRKFVCSWSFKRGIQWPIQTIPDGERKTSQLSAPARLLVDICGGKGYRNDEGHVPDWDAILNPRDRRRDYTPPSAGTQEAYEVRNIHDWCRDTNGCAIKKPPQSCHAYVNDPESNYWNGWYCNPQKRRWECPDVPEGEDTTYPFQYVDPNCGHEIPPPIEP